MPAPHYRAPLHCMKFALAALGGLPRTLAHSQFDAINEELVDAVLEEASKFSHQVLSPLNVKGDRHPAKKQEDGSVVTPPGFRAAYQMFVENGWNAAGITLERGGQGMPAVVSTLMNEMWHGANMAFGLCPMLTQSAIELLTTHGTVEQHLTYLAKLVSGEWTGTMCMTEPQAGSDVGAITTRATPEGEHFRIRGSKIYITFGEHDLSENIVHVVLARMDGAPAGVKGLSLFIVPKFLVEEGGKLTSMRNDITCVSLEEKMGLHGSPTCVLSFGDKEGAIGYLLGQPNEGIKAMFTMMNAARFAVGLQGVGVLSYALQMAEGYVQERIQGRTPSGHPAKIMEHPDVQRMLLTLQGHDLALRLFAIYFAQQQDVIRIAKDDTERKRAAERVELLTPIFKAHATHMAFTHCSTAMQIYGGLGYIEDTGIAQLLRDIRVAMIYEGTNGIQALDLVGRKLMQQEGTLVKDLLTEIWNTGISLQQSPNPVLKRLCGPLLDAAKHLEVATIWAMQKNQDATEKSRQSLYLMAEDYLQLLGYALEGWMLAQAANLAVDDEQYRRYLPRIGFFMHYVLPLTRDLSQRIIHSDTLVDWLPRA